MASTPSEKQLAARLAEIPLLTRTTAKQRRTLVKLGKVLPWNEGTTPVKQGSKGAALFVILDGSVDVFRDGTRIARLEEGDFAGEMALLRNEPRSADLVAVTDTTVFALGRPALSAALAAEPAIGMALLEAMAARDTVR
jgi:CRP-like cAMP-binding protein